MGVRPGTRHAASIPTGDLTLERTVPMPHLPLTSHIHRASNGLPQPALAGRELLQSAFKRRESTSHMRLGDALIQEGLITVAQRDSALVAQSLWRVHRALERHYPVTLFCGETVSALPTTLRDVPDAIVIGPVDECVRVCLGACSSSS